MLYKFLFFIIEYQTTIRFFQISLFEFEYTFENQIFFQFKFAKFIDLSNYTIVNTQLFYTYIVDIINSYVSNTKYIIQKLENNNYLFSTTLSISELFQQEVIWLNYYYLIFLFVNIKSFQERAFQAQYKEVVKLIKKYVNKIV